MMKRPRPAYESFLPELSGRRGGPYAPWEWYGEVAVDGSDGPWYDAPIGSKYRRISGSLLREYVKHADNGTNADWEALSATDAFSVRDYGATGDGTTYDTAAIQAAIAEAPDGSQLLFPHTASGYRLHGSGLTIAKRLDVMGVGGSVKLLADGLTDGAFALTLASGARRSHLRNFYIQGSTALRHGVAILEHDIKLTDFLFVGLDIGAYCNGYNGTIIEKSHFSQGRTYGIQLMGTANQSTIRDCTFFNFANTATACINLGDVTHALYGIWLYNNWFELNGCPLIKAAQYVSSILIDGGWMEDGGGASELPADAWRIYLAGSAYAQGLFTMRNVRVALTSTWHTNFLYADVELATIENVEFYQGASQPVLNFGWSKNVILRQVGTAIGEDTYSGLAPVSVKAVNGFSYNNPSSGNDIDGVLQRGSMTWGQGGSSPTAHTNLQQDSSFAAGHNLTAVGTTYAPTLAQVTDDGVYDNYCAQISFPANPGSISQCAAYTVPRTVTAGQNIRAGFWIKASRATNGVRVRISGQASLTIRSMYLDTTWRWYSLGSDNVATTGGYQLYFYTYNLADAVDVFVDDVQFEAAVGLQTVGPYVPTAAASLTTQKGLTLPGHYLGTVKMLFGAGSPLNVITAPVGSLYLRTDGGSNSCLYIKESGTDATGWVAK